MSTILEFNQKEIDVRQNYKIEDEIFYFCNIKNENVDFVKWLVKRYNLKNKQILDYGCGLGMFANLFSVFGCKVDACDYVDKQLYFAKKCCNPQVSFLKDDMFNTTLQKNKYDFIFCRDIAPLVKFDYKDRILIQGVTSIIESLTDDGIAVFIMNSNLSGKPSNNIFNYNLDEIINMFSHTGNILAVYTHYYPIIYISKKSSKWNFNNFQEKYPIKFDYKDSCFRQLSTQLSHIKLQQFYNQQTDKIIIKSKRISLQIILLKLYNFYLSGIYKMPLQKISFEFSSNTINDFDKIKHITSGDHDKRHDKHMNYKFILKQIIKTYLLKA